MKQIDFNKNISVNQNSVQGIFEIITTTSDNSTFVKLITGGTIGSFLPTNLFNTNGSLLSLPVGNSRWYLCIEGTMNSLSQVNSATLTIRTSLPPPISVTPYIPPTSFCFPIYAGMGASYTRLIGPSATLRTILLYQEYEIKNNNAATNFTNYYTLSFV